MTDMEADCRTPSPNNHATRLELPQSDGYTRLVPRSSHMVFQSLAHAINDHTYP